MYHPLRRIREYIGEHPVVVGTSLIAGVALLTNVVAGIYLREGVRRDRQAILFSTDEVQGRQSNPNITLQTKLSGK